MLVLESIPRQSCIRNTGAIHPPILPSIIQASELSDIHSRKIQKQTHSKKEN